MITNLQRLTIIAIREVAKDIGDATGSTVPLSALDPLTRRKWQNALFANLPALGFKDDGTRFQRLRFLSLIFKRPITTANELTWPECHALVKAINAPTVGADLVAVAREVLNGMA